MSNNLAVRKTGRKPNWFRAQCAEILDKENLVEFIGRVASGKEKETTVVISKEGAQLTISKPCSVDTRMDAFKMLAEWGVGKPGNIDDQDGDNSRRVFKDFTTDALIGALTATLAANDREKVNAGTI